MTDADDARPANADGPLHDVPHLDPVLDLSTRAILAGISPWLMRG